jgi:cytochrome P450
VLAESSSVARSIEPLEYDPLSPEVIADPYPWYERLLRGPAVHHDERNDLWVLSRYDDVHTAVRSHTALSSAEGVAYRRMWLPMMLTLDPPDHTRLRRIVSREFTPRGLDRWRPVVDRLAADAVRRLEGASTVDFVETVAWPFPVAVIAAVLGVPDEDLPLLRRISDDVIEGFKLGDIQNRLAATIVDLLSNRVVIDTITSLSMRLPSATGAFVRFLTEITRRLEGEGRWTEDVARAPRAVADLQGYCAALVRARRKRPADDLVTKLIAAHPDGQLSQSEIFWFFLLLLIAGNETTTNLLGNMLLALLATPGAWDALRRDPSLVPSAVNEALRFESPIQGFFRTTLVPYRVGDVEIPAGARVLLLFGAANRDPRRYPDPDTFVVGRNPTDHVGFGGGIHYCLGASLAEMEGQAVLRELLARTARVELAGPVERTRNPMLRGARRLPIRL